MNFDLRLLTYIQDRAALEESLKNKFAFPSVVGIVKSSLPAGKRRTFLFSLLVILFLVAVSACSLQDAVKPKVGEKGDFEELPVAPALEPQEPNPQAAPEPNQSSQEVSNTGSGGKKGTTWKVTLKDFKLMPRTLSISAGDTVVWLNEDERRGRPLDHILSSHFDEFRSPTFTKGQNFSHTFSEPGTYTYFDVLYKSRDLLQGTITVNGPNEK